MRISAVCAAIAWLLAPPVSLTADEIPRRELRTAPVALGGGLDAVLIYEVEAPLKVNEKAPRRIVVGSRIIRAKPGPAPVTLRILPEDAKAQQVQVETEYYVCEDQPDAPCFRRVAAFQIPVTATAAVVTVLELKTPRFAPVVSIP